MLPLATVDQLEKHLQTTFADPTGAEQALTLASGAVRAYCGWCISRENELFECYGDGSQVLSIPTLYLFNVISVVMDGDVIDPVALKVTLKGQILWASGWPKECTVLVDAEHGYDPVPDLVQLVTLDAAARQLSNPEGWETAKTGEVSRSWGAAGPSGLTQLHQLLLDRYRVF